MPDIDHALDEAALALDAGARERVESLLAPFLETRPLDARVPFALGLALAMGSDPAGASRMFAAVLEIAPDFDAARFNLAKSLKDQGRNADAELEYRRYLLRHPEDASALYNLANIAVQSDRLEKAAELFRKLLDLTPHHHDGRTNLALVEEQSGNRDAALELLEQVLAVVPDHPHANRLQRSILSKMVSRWHFTMINDRDRNDAYEKAIAAVVAGKHVLEIGAGSGLLSMMAARHGARSVVACEMVEPLANAARRIVARNGFADRIDVVAKKSMQVEVGRELAQRADVLIAEVFDVGLLGEGFVPALVHAHAELLVESPILIPAGARGRAMLISCPALRPINPVGRISGFDLSDFNIFQTEGYEPIDLTNMPYEALTEPFTVSELDFATLGLETVETSVSPRVIADGICQAIVFWFELDLGAGARLSSYPLKPTSHWKQAVQFFASNRPMRAGDTASVTVVQSPNGYSFELV